MDMRQIIALMCFLLTTPLFAAETHVLITRFPELEQGLMPQNIQRCHATVEPECEIHKSIVMLMNCADDKMKTLPYCQQNYAFLTKKHAFIRSIKEYGNIGLLYATVVAADHNDEYFLIDSQGNVIEPSGALDIKRVKQYKNIVKQYPNVFLEPMTVAPPIYKKLKNGQQALIFQQLLKNGCHGCSQAGLANVQYAFDKDGKFIDATVVKLIPHLDDNALTM